MTDKRTCTVEGCKKDVRSLGLCSNHYQRMRRNGDPTVSAWALKRANREPKPLPTKKRCATCKNVKAADQFYVQRRKNGYEILSAYCKPCQKAYYDAKRLKERQDRPPKPPKPDCAFPGCDHKGKTRLGKGNGPLYCMGHWQQNRAGRELTPLRKRNVSYISDSLRRCTACHEVKSVEAFYIKTSGYPQSECKECCGLTGRFHFLRREGRLDEALEVLERMPEPMRIKIGTKYASDLNESEFERSNGLEVPA